MAGEYISYFFFLFSFSYFLFLIPYFLFPISYFLFLISYFLFLISYSSFLFYFLLRLKGNIWFCLAVTSPQIGPNISSSMKAPFPEFLRIYVNCFPVKNDKRMRGRWSILNDRWICGFKIKEIRRQSKQKL